MMCNRRYLLLVLITSCFITAMSKNHYEDIDTKEEIILSEDERYEIMQELPARSFLMGTDAKDAINGESPSRTYHMNSFFIDKYPVSNKSFKKFLKRKRKYRLSTSVNKYSYVFKKFLTKYASYDSDDHIPGEPYLVKVFNASWNNPEGPSSGVHHRMYNPVVHVSYHDAKAFCLSKKKRLPTEIEWEYAVRGTLLEKKFPWGGRFKERRANFWQGGFPTNNTLNDGYEGISPIGAYEIQNDFGLYDMLGNVWEWTDTVFRLRKISKQHQPTRQVVRGGSFLDSHDGKVNSRIRVTTRKGIHPETTAYNIGFRCALSQDTAKTIGVKIIKHDEL